MKRLLPILSLLGFCLLGCADEEEPVQTRKTYSYGYRDGEQVYFLMAAKVFQKRAPVWFIMPIERSPKVYFHKLFFYRYDPATGRLDRLATLREDMAPGLNIKNSRFIRKGDLLIYAYQVATSVKRGLLHVLGSWDLKKNAPGAVSSAKAIPDEDPLFTKHFADYRSPYTANPGIVGISELRRKLLAGIPEERWGLKALDGVLKEASPDSK